MIKTNPQFIKFTPMTWQQILGFTILDPDGWDRTGNFQADWDKPLSFNEFMDKAEVSTCSRHPSREALKAIAANRICPNIPDAKAEVERLLG